MATRSTISKVNSNGSIESIYCHYDGDLNGEILKNYYNTQEKVDELIALGSLSSLHKNIKPTLSTHSFNNQEKDVTVAYHRDRGEDLIIRRFINAVEYSLKSNREQYNYIWMDGQWYLSIKQFRKIYKNII